MVEKPTTRQRRRRRRSTSNTDSLPDLATKRQIDQLISDIETQQQQDNSSHAPLTELIESKPTSNNETGEAKSMLTMQIDQIKAELLEEEYLNPTEPEYLDETHSWGNSLPKSEDYWHFVGRYE